jgi:hypothetical protein
MYNVMLFNRATKTYSRIDFENKDAKSAWKFWSSCKKIRQAYNGGFTHAAVYADTDSIKSTKPNIEPIGGAKN